MKGNLHLYSLCGFTLGSNIDIDILPRVMNQTPDVKLLRCNLDEIPKTIDHPIIDTPTMKMNHDTFHAHVKDFGTFYYQENTLWLASNDSQFQTSFNLHLNLILNLLLIARRMILLHGAVITYRDHCFAIIGASGIGKSTLSYRFYKEGAKILSDEMCCLIRLTDNQCGALPGLPKLSLREDLVNREQIDFENLLKIQTAIENKYWLKLGAAHCNQTMPIQQIYILKENVDEQYSQQPLSGVAKYNAILETVRMRDLTELYFTPQELFSKICELAQGIKITEIYTPKVSGRAEILYKMIVDNLTASRQQPFHKQSTLQTLE